MCKIVFVILGLAAMAMALPNAAEERTFFSWAGNPTPAAPSFANFFNLFNWAYTPAKPIGSPPVAATPAATTAASAATGTTAASAATTAASATPVAAPAPVAAAPAAAPTIQWVPLGALLFRG